MSQGEQDAARDGLAMVEAVHRGDLDAVRCLLRWGDTPCMVTFLAGVVDDLIEDLAGWLRSDPDALLATLRDHHGGAQ